MISKEGERFIANMRGYLISKGKTDAEIEDFLEEAKVHLIEGEKDGKSVEDIFGKSPKEYAQEVDSVMTVSVIENIKDFINLFVGIFSFILVASLIDAPLNLSLLEIIGFPSMFILWIVFSVIALRTNSFKSEYRQIIFDFLIMMVPSSVTMGVLYFRNFHDQTILILDGEPRYILAVIAAVAMLINLASLFNVKFSIIYVVPVVGSLLLFEYFQLEEIMYNQIRFFIAGGIAYVLFRAYGRDILLQ